MNIEIGAGGETPPLEDHIQVDAYGKPTIRADIRALPFRHSLDRVYASHVLEHLPDASIVAALKSCRGALRPGGVLELYVPDLAWMLRKFLNTKSLGARWALILPMIYGSQENEGQYHRTGFSTNRLATCLTAAGFRQIKVRRARRKEHRMHMEVHAVAVA